jgi:4-hydroxybenzoate polyprenyltransferase
MMAICIPFDIRDLAIDAADNVSTLPHLFGENKTRNIAVAFMFIYVLLIIPEYTSGMLNIKIFITLLISALVNGILVFMSSSKRSEYFYVAGIDGTMILQGVMLMVVQLWCY